MHDYVDVDYEVVSWNPLVMRVITDEEELTVTGYPVILRVMKVNNKYSVWVNVIISTRTNKPRPGPLCTPTMLNARPAGIKGVDVVRDGSLTLKLSAGGALTIIIKPTNISVYPDYRDQFGSPCVMLNWAVFW
ncbi:MAG: hypothetical protein L7H08_09090 [Vulcanisaeta sp.]|jgi:hypothetical protein|nr:MAG: hypothetical protein AT714_02600 [Vulcanisaeta sp. OSP_8]MCG2867667.1 hypothetical protein [Vulcanisaeta sp.]